MNSVRAVFAGLATWDVIQLVERVPGPNEKVAALDFLLAAGGPATNAAVAFAACGASPTLVSVLPEHPVSALIASDLAEHGVRLEVARGHDGPPVTASVLVTRGTGERAVVSPSGVGSAVPDRGASASGENGSGVSASGARWSSANAGAPTAARLDGVTAVLIDGYFRDVALPIAAAARERGIPVILDAGSAKPYSDELVRAADVVIASGDYAPPGTDGDPKAVVAYCVALGAERVIITRGADPVVVRTPAGSAKVAVTAVPVVDTLGAGDFFHGAFAYRVATLGLDAARMAEDVAFAAKVAGRSLATFGTRAWLAQP